MVVEGTRLILSVSFALWTCLSYFPECRPFWYFRGI